MLATLFNTFIVLSVFSATLSHCSNSCEVTSEECSLSPRLERTPEALPNPDHYGVYRTEKTDCVLVRHKHELRPVITSGDALVGVMKLLHTHKILMDEPYAPREATIYNVACPEGYLSYFKLLSLDFEDSCSDYLHIKMHSGQVETICGCHGNATSTSIIGDIEEIFFRSNNFNRMGDKGFTAVLQCFNPQDAHREECSNGEDLTLMSARRRRRRRRNIMNSTLYLPQGSSEAVLDSLSEAAFDVLARKSSRQNETEGENNIDTAYFSNEDIDQAICHMRSCSAILRATARVVLNHTRMTQPGRIDRIYRSKFTPPTAMPTTEPPLAPLGPRCTNITSMPMCSDMGYSQAHFPNFRGHQTPEKAHVELADFLPVVRSACSNAILHLLCSVYAPFCSDSGREVPVKTYPCIEMCVYVRQSCEASVESFGLQWPQALDCNNSAVYKSRNSSEVFVYCPPVLEDVRIPDSIETVSPPPHLPEASTDAVTTSVATPTTAATTATTSATTSAVRTIATTHNTTIRPVTEFNPDRVKQYTCSAMRGIPTCEPLKPIGWSHVSFPNFRNHETQIEAQQELDEFQSLLRTQCSNALPYLLCAVYAPFCDNDYPQLRLRPCKELCVYVRDQCESNLLPGTSLPEHLDCDDPELFPPRVPDNVVFCPDDIPHLVFPPN